MWSALEFPYCLLVINSVNSERKQCYYVSSFYRSFWRGVIVRGLVHLMICTNFLKNRMPCKITTIHSFNHLELSRIGTLVIYGLPWKGVIRQSHKSLSNPESIILWTLSLALLDKIVLRLWLVANNTNLSVTSMVWKSRYVSSWLISSFERSHYVYSVLNNVGYMNSMPLEWPEVQSTSSELPMVVLAHEALKQDTVDYEMEGRAHQFIET